MCYVCFDEKPMDETFAMECGHRFCKECWGDGLSNAVESGGPGGTSALEFKCMDAKCQLTVGEDVFRALLNPSRMQRFQKLLTLSFVDDSSDLVWCPSTGCAGVVAHSKRRKTVCCGNGHRFCFSCMGPAHSPVSCEEHKGDDITPHFLPKISLH